MFLCITVFGSWAQGSNCGSIFQFLLVLSGFSKWIICLLFIVGVTVWLDVNNSRNNRQEEKGTSKHLSESRSTQGECYFHHCTIITVSIISRIWPLFTGAHLLHGWFWQVSVHSLCVCRFTSSSLSPNHPKSPQLVLFIPFPPTPVSPSPVLYRLVSAIGPSAIGRGCLLA